MVNNIYLDQGEMIWIPFFVDASIAEWLHWEGDRQLFMDNLQQTMRELQAQAVALHKVQDEDWIEKYDPPAPLCTFVLEPKVQVGTLFVNRVSQMNGHTRHNKYSFPG